MQNAITLKERSQLSALRKIEHSTMNDHVPHDPRVHPSGANQSSKLIREGKAASHCLSTV